MAAEAVEDFVLATETSSLGWWTTLPSSTKWLIIGTGVVALGGIGLYIGTRKVKIVHPPPGQGGHVPKKLTYKRFQPLLRKLNGRPEEQMQALEDALDLTRIPEMHNALSESGVMEVMLRYLAQRPDNEAFVAKLCQVLANLATCKELRDKLGTSTTMIDDMLWYLKQDEMPDSTNEDILRALMNLSVAAVNENVIREKGGLEVLVALLQKHNIPRSTLFQDLRVLVNLASNKWNRQALITEHNMVDITLMLAPKYADDSDILHRLLRIISMLSVDSTLPVYKKLADPSVARIITKALQGQDVEQPATVMQEICFYAIYRLLSERTGPSAPTFLTAMTEFRNTLLEDRTYGKTGLELILDSAGKQGPLSNENVSNYLALVNALRALVVTGDAKSKLRGHKNAMRAVQELAHHPRPDVRKEAEDLLNETMIEVVD